ncbi:MAG: GerMN domain-containing protein [Lachnospiraceae bacterium]|nr:GerMN domain-containing protein [Lachnospiraceae bacterium]
MRRKKISLCLLFFFLLGLISAGCGKGKEDTSEYKVYYVNKEVTKTVAVGYEPKAKGSQEMIQEFLGELFRNIEHPDYRRAVPKGVKLESWKLDNSQLYLYFNSAYMEMDNVSEVLGRAALVRTLTQVEGVECISFYVADSPLMDANGTLIGLMTAESFIENPGEQINTIQTNSITLYFSNKEGTGLIPEVQEVHYSSNISLEKLVMEQLLKGPKGKGARSAIPDGTKLVSVSVLDGVGFVNLNEGFLNQNYEIAEPVVIYSIVNSLAELPNINKVQISVNGDSNLVYREKLDLNTMYERNLDYLDESAKTQEKQIEEGGEKVIIKEEEGTGD